jgi:HTH-type transcriptional regulator/antitoxin MqsA
VFSRDATERVRRMVHGEAKPIKSIQMDVFAYRYFFLTPGTPYTHP